MPARSSAAVITNSPMIVMTAGRLKPDRAWSWLNTPVSPRTRRTIRATTSGRSASETMRMTATMMTASSSISRGDRPMTEPASIASTEFITNYQASGILRTFHSSPEQRQPHIVPPGLIPQTADLGISLRAHAPRFLVGIIPFEHYGDSLEHDLEIEPGRPILNIEYVERHHFFEMQAIPATNLPQP